MKKPKRYEYDFVTDADLGEAVRDLPADEFRRLLKDYANKVGMDGWRLVQIAPSPIRCVVFERRV